MSRYINQNSKGERLPTNGKARALISGGATVIPEPTEHLPNQVVVVENEEWDAALYLDTPYQLNRVLWAGKAGDDRPRTFLTYCHADQCADKS